MEQRIRLRRDTASQWVSSNPVLALGEPGLETNTGLQKIGDGATLWNDLPYSGPAKSYLHQAGISTGFSATLGQSELDRHAGIIINQTAGSSSLALPAPTNATTPRDFTVVNRGTADLPVQGATVLAGSFRDFKWTPLANAWLPASETAGQISDHAASLYMDVGNMRMAWGRELVSGGVVSVTFPAVFAAPPFITLTFEKNGAAGLTSSEVCDFYGLTVGGMSVRCVSHGPASTAAASTGAFHWHAVGLRP